ncbi:MAG: zinc-dependent metalloprotease [Gemmatimonadota bacterium]|nr:zinc-dependent metalloprotease [Gemmatimonadota bacterium]
MVQRLMSGMWMMALAAAVIAPAPGPLLAQEDTDLPSIEEKTEAMTRIEGFIPLYWDEEAGTLWLEIGRWDEELLHYTSLPAGMGQNDIGLNRGDLGSRQVVVFRRVGPKVLMEQPNYDYRANSDDALERRSVEDGFPTSILWGFTAAAETEDRVLVDATDFLLTDWAGVETTLERSQGSWSLEPSRSAPFMPRTKGFPSNTEIEVTLTFTSDDPGGLVRSVTPTGNAVTVRQHHSFVELPALDGSFEPRRADPRAGYGGPSFMDFARPIEEDLTVRYIARHRLEKQDPSAERSEPVEPIVYYLDPGTPEPVRSALLEGGAWWNEAFEEAGFIDAFRMEILPDTADPMDVRYNVVQWVHRSTRGWSYGSSVQDPRTGEILKGHVTLGSLRVRQDYLIGEGLTAPYLTGDEDPTDVREMALQRIRQLSAHEIGHTIGLSHNYIASAQTDDGIQSVMDYPHPRVRLEDGEVTLGRDSYADGIGAWDKIAVRYGYTDFPPGTDEAQALEDILAEGMEEGITFITDQDARPAGSAHPNVHLWDNGATAAGELERMLDVRRTALDAFGETAVRTGEPLATIEEALVPLFLHHRYQAEATTKVVAGQYYTYAMRGDGQTPLRPVPAPEQQRALNVLMRTLDPAELTIPESVLETLPPRPARYGPHRELFERHTGVVFDAIAPARAAAEATLRFLFHPERAARMIQQRAFDTTLPGLEQVIARVREATFGARPVDNYEAEIVRAVERAFVERLISLAAEAPMAQVRAITSYQLEEIAVEVAEASVNANPADRAHNLTLAADISRFLERPYEPVETPSAPDMPPGSPIGDGGMSWTDLSCPWGRR